MKRQTPATPEFKALHAILWPRPVSAGRHAGSTDGVYWTVPRPVIPSTQPPWGEHAPGWISVGGGLALLEGEVQIPDDAEGRIAELDGPDKVELQRAIAQSRRPTTIPPEAVTVQKLGDKLDL